MNKEPTQRGIVTETLPNLNYRVELEGGRQIICYTSGKMRKNKIYVLVGDKVDVVLDPYGGKATNRIVRRQ
jgi:translation initiation factor IF-1